MVMDKRPLWNDDKTNGALWSAVVVAAVFLFGGSYWPGWQLDSTAEKSVYDAGRVALVRVLAPVCAERFRTQPNLTVVAAALKEVDSWKRDEYLVKNNWVIPSGSDSVDETVGAACAEMLADLTK